MKIKFKTIAVTGLLFLSSACGSAISTNAQNANPPAKAPVVEKPVTPPVVEKPVAPPVVEKPVVVEPVEKPTTTSDVKEVLLNYSDRIFFVTNSAEISDKAREIIQNIAPVLVKAKNTHYIVEGHADERGTRAYNLALGEKRANALKDALVANDVNSDYITTVTYGKDRPFDPGHNPQAWSKNRRAVIIPSDINSIE